MNDIVDRFNAALSGRYVLERQVGEGGMAWVYLATDLKHDRKVAVKVLKHDLVVSLGAERFLAEIRTTASLQHPHILPLFDSGAVGTFLFYVMPFIDGETLKERLKRERQLPVDEAVRIGRAVANALHAAHEAGVVHRDIKPSNILLTGGEPLVADFGIAVAVGVASDDRATETGLAIGSPYYMAPEQAAGDDNLGPATDIFALACVLYEMLIGDPPYTGSTAQAVLGKILTGEPVSSTGVRPSIPIHVDAAIRRALEKVPADRFTTASDFSKALTNRSFRHGEWKMGDRKDSEKRWKRAAAAGWTVGAIAIAAAAAFALQPRGGPTIQRFAVHANAVGTPALLPDGTGMVYASPTDDGSPQLWVRRWQNLEATPIPGTSGRLQGTPVVSPDGIEVAFYDRRDLRIAPIEGGAIRTVATDAGCCARWADDGYLYYSSAVGRNIMRVPAGGGAVEEVTSPENLEGTEGDFQILPGGDVALFTVWASAPRVEAVRLSTGERAVVTEGLRPFTDDDGHIVFATMLGQLMAAEFDPRSLQLSSAPVPVAEDIFVNLRNQPVFTVSRSGSLAYIAVDPLAYPKPVWVDREGNPAPLDVGLSYDAAGNGPIGLSPDGRRVALSIIDGDRTDIWVMDLDRDQAPRRRVTFDALTNDRPTWMPDGNTLVYLRRVPGRSVWTLRVDGSQSASLLLEDPTHRLLGGELSRDGRWYVYRRGQDAQDLDAATGLSDVYALDLVSGSGGRPVVATPFDERAPALSPNGEWLAYVSDRSGQAEVYVSPFPDTQDVLIQVSVDGGSEPAWAPDGSELFYRDGALDMIAAAIGSGGGFDVTRQTTLFSSAAFQSSATTRTYQVHPDGRFLMMQNSELGGDVVLVQNWMDEVVERLNR